MQRARPLQAWVTITTLSTLVTWQVVAAASDEVNDVPRTPLVVAVGAPPSTVYLTAPTSTETSQPPVSSTSVTPTSTTAVETTTPSTTAAPPPPGPSPTSTTQPSSSTGMATVGSAGGTVTVSYGGGEVYFEGATPLPGYSVEVEDEGPEHVVVAFQSDEETIEVRIEWKDGELVSRVETDD